MVKMIMRKKCRLWWPANLSSQAPPTSSYLFGWFTFSSETSLDVIVAFACNEPTLSSSNIQYSDLQEFLLETNKIMPTSLQNKCKISLLGYYVADIGVNGQLVGFGNDTIKYIKFTSDKQHLSGSQSKCRNCHGSWICGCHKLGGLLKQGGLAALDNMWIKLMYGLSETVGRRIHVIPKLDHLHWNGETVFQLDTHASLNPGTTSSKKPQWFDDLGQKDPHPDLDIVILAMNSANAAQLLLNGHLHAESSTRFHIVYMVTTFVWKLFAVFVASFSTIIYIFLQYGYILFGCVSNSCMHGIVGKLFSNTWQNIQVRCCHILYWPIFLQDHGKRSRTCVDFVEKAAFHKHLMWSNIVVDVFFGSLLGRALWYMAEPACSWVSDFACDITNYWLRTGCVWLMGNPAGFKLNTELAGVLGMISLNAIQIWSTLWVFMGFLFIHFTKGLAVCAILFGLTTAATLIIDMISIVTTHVLTLHLFMSLLYSTQIQTIAALWRLFRGRKWNPLRQRLDSYDYTVEQHVVGSLLFTPMLLLLPTTSAFYIFFTSMQTAVSFTCTVVKVVISIIHATPYAKIFIWLKTEKRFPSGIWFEVASCQYSDPGVVSGSNSFPGKLPKTACESGIKSTVLVSFLQSNYLNLGEVVGPHYRSVYSAFSRSSITSLAYGLLTGSIPYPIALGLPPKLPWIVIPWKEYWRLCHDAVYACRLES